MRLAGALFGFCPRIELMVSRFPLLRCEMRNARCRRVFCIVRMQFTNGPLVFFHSMQDTTCKFAGVPRHNFFLCVNVAMIPVN